MYIIPVERKSRPLKFKLLNQLERNTICNGCGGKGGWFRPPDYCFRASCDHHDFRYWLGGGEIERKRTDQSFLRAMIWDAENKPGGGQRSWWRRYWLKGAAWRYYWAVRWMGKSFFNYNPSDDPWSALERAMSAAGFDVEAEFEPDE